MHLALKAAKDSPVSSACRGSGDSHNSPRSSKIEQDAVNEFGKKNATSLVDEDSELAPTSEVS